MRTKSISTTVTIAAAAALAIGGCTTTSDHSQHDTSADSSESSPQFNDADVTYAQGMAMHHQQAVEMSDIILGKSGVDPDVTTMATQIKKAQGPEIKEMQGWLKDWGADDSGHAGHGDGSGEEMSHEGMVSPADITKLKDADGKRASALFLDQMIEHHEGAVTMAKEHRKDGKNPEAVTFSASVIKDQNAEIQEMRTMRRSL